MSKPTLDGKGIIETCASCGRRNRVPFKKLPETGTCGHCQAPLPAIAAPLDIPSESVFAALVAGSPLPVVVDFWAPWCGPCRQVAPELEKVAVSHAGKWLVVKINTEALPGLGARPASAIEAWVKSTV